MPASDAGLVRDAFHQAAVADEHVRMMVDDRMARAIEFGGEQRFRERHADRVGEPLSERPRRRLDAWRHAALRVPRRLRVQLAEALQLVDRQVVAGQVQEAIEKHRAVAVREHEAIAVRPLRMGRMVAQMAPPERECDLRHSHRHPGMPRFRRFHCVHRERAERVREVAVGHGCGSGGDCDGHGIVR